MLLFHNKHIIIEHSTIFYEDWYGKNIRCVNKSMNGNLIQFDFREFRETFSID